MNNNNIDNLINLYGGKDDEKEYTISLLDKYNNKENVTNLLSNLLSKKEKLIKTYEALYASASIDSAS